MFRRYVLILMVAAAPVCLAQKQASDVDKDKGSVEKKAKKKFTIDRVIAPVLKYMAVPETRMKINGVQMAISSPSEKAQLHVKQGFALVHAQWDFEAYRHFCVAIQEDPDCLMAYCGVALALAKPYSEYVPYRRAAVERMLDLMEIDKKRSQPDRPPRFPDMEKEFAASVATLVSTSPRAAAVMFQHLSNDYPKFLQARLLSVFLSRGGYDIMGDPTPPQLSAIQRTRAILKKNPDNPMVIGFWLSLNTEVPDSVVSIKEELLPYAKQLVKMNPEMPSWHYILGHYAWRTGDYQLAESSFTKAADLYSAWMKEEKISVNDCDGFVKAKCYLANTYYQRGDFEKAIEVATALRMLPLDPSRPRSSGNGILMWRAYSLTARLYATRGAEGDLNKALKSMPGKKELDPFVSHPKYPTLAGVYTDALSIYLGCRKAIDAKDVEAAISLHRLEFRKRIKALANVLKGASQASHYSHYLRAVSSLTVYDMELAGLIAMLNPKKTRVVALGRFMAARDKQRRPTIMMPPMTLSPMGNRIAEYYLSVGEPKMAVEAYEKALKRYVKNAASTKGLEKSRKEAEEQENKKK